MDDNDWTVFGIHLLFCVTFMSSLLLMDIDFACEGIMDISVGAND